MPLFNPPQINNLELPIALTASDLTLGSTHHTVLVDASSGEKTITLPAASLANKRLYVIKKVDSSGNTVTIEGDGSETIDGATSQSLDAQWESVTVQSNGTLWRISVGYSPMPTRFSQTFQTTGATPTVAYSVPVPASSAAYVEVDFLVTNTTFSNAASGDAEAGFRRTSGGNIVRATGNGGLLDAAIRLIGDFTMMPRAEIVANASTQTADIRLTGLSGVTLNWVFTVLVRRNSP